ncbi:glycoside hydrolase family 18 protein [Aaosphaeria arxii CBS 175.79]|uniref:chitinase n=1 Tax=Aaosphaeria arxii CBS 175.79 TaxID=1450172 RepID=A0A6A5X9L0_9PLEO|nr:glycoside hydrolase family 18 protein [Aaosphaeria arxii CBS 175.79]KAF2009434.1 glycoside hydrolase family 18 protein [Aaosphaeria arxii CBS 175.79]
MRFFVMGPFSILCLLSAMVSVVFAGFNTNSKSNIAIYWGQNSAGTQQTQQRLSTYCNNPDVDVIILSFLLRFSGTGGQPVLNFANQGDRCTLFAGTELFRCPEIEADIQTCQSQSKTILLSLGGDAYTEGGFTSAAAATEGANKIWAMFGPVQSGSTVPRPFGSAILDGFDFDFEANVSNMAVFGNRLRTLFSSVSKKFYLTAAPQCPFPDWYNKDIIDNVPLDFLNVQFYNNGCGASSYVPGQEQQWNFNFDQWDTWAKSASKNPNVKVLLGVPANTGAGRGYLTPSALAPVIQYSSKYSSFAGVMMWDASQAWQNPGFISNVKSTLRSLAKMKRQLRWGRRAIDIV